MLETPLDAETLALARETAESTMTETASVRVNTGTVSQHGGIRENWTIPDPARAYKCRRQAFPGSQGEGAQPGDRQGVQIIRRILLPWNADVDSGMRLIVGSDTYNVTGTNSDSTDRVSLVCTVAKV
jgi:head-tail adaptor